MYNQVMRNIKEISKHPLKWMMSFLIIVLISTPVFSTQEAQSMDILVAKYEKNSQRQKVVDHMKLGEMWKQEALFVNSKKKADTTVKTSKNQEAKVKAKISKNQKAVATVKTSKTLKKKKKLTTEEIIEKIAQVFSLFGNSTKQSQAINNEKEAKMECKGENCSETQQIVDRNETLKTSIDSNEDQSMPARSFTGIN